MDEALELMDEMDPSKVTEINEAFDSGKEVIKPTDWAELDICYKEESANDLIYLKITQYEKHAQLGRSRCVRGVIIKLPKSKLYNVGPAGHFPLIRVPEPQTE